MTRRTFYRLVPGSMHWKPFLSMTFWFLVLWDVFISDSIFWPCNSVPRLWVLAQGTLAGFLVSTGILGWLAKQLHTEVPGNNMNTSD